jgi:hypothetical protein
MKKILLLVTCVLGQLILIHGQDAYKQNFLNLLNKLPEIKSCESSYNFFICKDNICNGYKAVKTNMSKAAEGLSSAQLAANSTITSSAQPGTTMTKDQGEALQKKLEKMTPEEKQKWAMENAQSYMNPNAGHVNQDADNDIVNDAVNYVTQQQQADMKDAMKPNDLDSQLKKIEDKYLPQKNAILKTLQDALKDKNLTLSNYMYVGGEASDAEIARQTKAIKDFEKNIAPVYDAELIDKLTYIKTLAKNLTTKYNTLEAKVAATHYGDDAEEAINKNQLYMAHQTVLNKVLEIFGEYEDVLHDYANKYANLIHKEQVKNFD